MNLFSGNAVETFRNEEGENVERVCLAIGNHDVQVLRFNGNNESLLVKVDDHISQISIDEVNDFVRRYI